MSRANHRTSARRRRHVGDALESLRVWCGYSDVQVLQEIGLPWCALQRFDLRAWGWVAVTTWRLRQCL